MDDVLSAVDYLKTLPYVDMDRLGIMGWSHGGYITLFTVFRDQTPFKAAAAIVPVTNLVFRLSYKGPAYQRRFRDAEAHPGAAIREARALHSALAALQRRQTEGPAARARRHERHRRELRGGPADGRRAARRASRIWPRRRSMSTRRPVPPAAATRSAAASTRVTLRARGLPEQIDSWNRTWTFFEWNLRPSLDKSTTSAARRPE